MKAQQPSANLEEFLRDRLLQSIGEDERNSLAPRAVRELCEQAPDLVTRVGVALLRSEPEPRCRRLALLLMNCPLFLARLLDPQRFPRAEALEMCRYFMSVEPAFDVLLAHLLPDRSGRAECLKDEAAARGLEILDEISNGGRLIHALAHLSDSRDPRIASKANLVLGRRVSNSSWLERRLTVPDARLRANLLESLWGRRVRGARETFLSHLADENNRVVGNAILGLHLLGDDKAMPRLREITKHPDALFRATAAWVLGRIGDEEAAGVLRGMAADTSPVVRRCVLRALVGIRRAAQALSVETPVVSPAPAREEKPQPPATEPAKEPEPEQVPQEETGLRLDGSAYW